MMSPLSPVSPEWTKAMQFLLFPFGIYVCSMALAGALVGVIKWLVRRLTWKRRMFAIFSWQIDLTIQDAAEYDRVFKQTRTGG
jgi:hypothetical protein